MIELKTKYYSINNETVMAYLKLCVQCQEKNSAFKNNINIQTILEPTCNLHTVTKL